jgi:cytoskeleton protein RodZ
MREIDLREIADRTKISLRYLKAMEQDRFDLLPAPVFAKGFLREYAKYVGLNPDEVVNFYLSAHQEAVGGEGDEEAPADRGGAASPWTWGVLLALAGILLVALVAYLAFYAQSRRGDRQETPAPPAAAPPVERGPVDRPPAAALPLEAPVEARPAATPWVEAPVEARPAAALPLAAPAGPPAPAAPLEVTLDFTQECWVEAVVDGRDRLSELHVQGESLQLAAVASVLLANVGNPAGVEVQVNGIPFPLGGTAGRPVRDVRIDLATLERLRSGAVR